MIMKIVVVDNSCNRGAIQKKDVFRIKDASVCDPKSMGMGCWRGAGGWRLSLRR